MNKEEFKRELDKLKVDYTDEMLEQLEIYKNFLQEYNKHTNLTRIDSDEDIYLKHFYDSLTIVKVIDLNRVKNLLDIGTGAGFPGMILKIFYPNLKVTLIDSNNKKIKFLTELKEKLKLNVEIVYDRVENFTKNNLNKYDVVTSRAVANLRVLAELSIPLVSVNGFFIPLKGNILEELKEATSTLDIMHVINTKHLTFNLYNDMGIRNIYVFKKMKETNRSSLRTYDKIVKKPLKKNYK